MNIAWISKRHFHYCIMVWQARVVQILSRGRKVWLSNKTVVKAIIERFEYLLSKNCALISFHFLNVCPGFIKVIFAWLRRPSKFKTFIFSACSFSFTIIWKQEYLKGHGFFVIDSPTHSLDSSSLCSKWLDFNQLHITQKPGFLN